VMLIKINTVWLSIYKGLFFASMYFLISWLFKTNSYRSFSELIKHKIG
jgi:hypothetical protein